MPLISRWRIDKCEAVGERLLANKMKSLRFPVLVLAVAATWVGCDATTNSAAPPQQPPAAATVSAPAAPAAPASNASIVQASASIASALPNAEYLIESTISGTAPLRDGIYEEAIPNSSSRTIVQLGPQIAYGDLDGDHVEDAAVTLLGSSGGSGDFVYVAAVLDQDGVARPVDSVLIGDRVIIEAIRIVDATINVTWRERKKGEPMSSPPGVEVSREFVLHDGKVVASDNLISRMRGLYTWGAEVETFQPCGSTRTFWVVGDAALLQPLRDRSADLARTRDQPYQPVYVEASGMSEGKATDGFAMDYDAVYRITTVHAVDSLSPNGCRVAR